MIFLYIGGFRQNGLELMNEYMNKWTYLYHLLQLSPPDVEGQIQTITRISQMKQTSKSFSEETYAQDPDLLVPGRLAIQRFFNSSIFLCFTAASKHANLQRSCIDSSRDVLLKGACSPIDLYQQGCCAENVPNALEKEVHSADVK